MAFCGTIASRSIVYLLDGLRLEITCHILIGLHLKRHLYRQEIQQASQGSFGLLLTKCSQAILLLQTKEMIKFLE